MSFDQQLTVAGLCVSAIAAVAGIVAAIYARRADRTARAASDDERRRWQRTIQPRPVATVVTQLAGEDIPESVKVHVANAGGAVAIGYLLVRVGRGLYGGTFNFPQHQAPLYWNSVPKIGETPEGEGSEVVLILAQDVDGNWWDCERAGELLADVPAEGVGTDPFGEWLIARAAQRGITLPR